MKPFITKISLGNKIIVLTTAITIVMMTCVIWFTSIVLRQSVEETYNGQLQGMTIAINGRYEESHVLQDVQQIFDYIQYKNKKVIELTLHGMDGSILASTDRAKIGLPSKTSVLEQARTDKSLVTRINHDGDGIPKAQLVAPLKEDGTTVGAIVLLLDTSEETKLVASQIRTIAWVCFLIGVVMLVLLLFMIRKLLIRPLLRLRQAASVVKQGQDYNHVDLNASLEINEVAAAFNDMVDNLDDRYEQLQHALETLQSTQKQLVQSEKMVALGGLVAGIAHEINTPLGIGVTATSYMDQRTKEITALYSQNKMKKSDLDTYLQSAEETTSIIMSNLQRASELIRSFKQVSVDQSSEAKRRFKLKSYIEEVLLSLNPRIKKTKLCIRIDSPQGDIEVDTYPGAVSQIITNFIMNSTIHAYEADQAGTIRIGIAKLGGMLCINYSDDGKGMTPETVGKIFDPFFTTNRGGGGTGLGMNIVYNIVTQTFGGTIRCESELGRGTSFIIEIPDQEDNTI
ncbi:sensor histidine kinase [Paenibacillus sp. MBLB4367]|uniref:sensor histidine kinase n=1 Tax=Paenibacillus sp. MBLB4367 TaxID=3384767 RepID=UPI003907FC84